MPIFKFPWDDKGTYVEVEATTRKEAIDKLFVACKTVADQIVEDVMKDQPKAPK